MMRVSVFHDDPGYANNGAYRGCKVFIDGIERTGVFTADEEKRMAVVAVLTEHGGIQLKDGRVLTETVYGHVRIEAPCHKPDSESEDAR